MNIFVTLLVAMGGSSAAAFTSRPVKQQTTPRHHGICMSSLNNDGYYSSSGGQNNYRSKSNGIYNGDYSGDDYLRNRNGAYGNNNWGRNNKWDRNNSLGSSRGGVSSSNGLRRYQPEFQDYNGYGSRGGGRGLTRQISGDYGYDNYSYDPYYYGDQYQSPINYGYSPYNRQGSSEDFRRVSNNDRYRRRDDFRSPSYDSSSGGRGYGLESRTFGGRTTPYGASYGRQFGGGNYASEGFRQGNSVNRIQNYLTPREREMSQQRQNFGARYGFQQQYDVNRGNVRGGSSNDFRRGRAFDRYQDFQTPREREMQQMRDNRALGRGQYYDSYDGYGGSGRRDDYYNMGRREYDDYDYSSGRGVYARRGGDYEPEVVGYQDSYSGRGNNRQRSSGWDNLRNVFKL